MSQPLPPTGDSLLIESIWQQLVVFLQQMDVEATSQFVEDEGVWPSGLRQYHKHSRNVSSEKAGCEVAWAMRLVELLRSAGVSADTSVCYPSYALPSGKQRQFADLRVTLQDGRSLWIEIKGSWPVCFRVGKTGAVEAYVNSRYRSFMLQETLADFEKLTRLKCPEAHHIGLLLVGFDTPLRRLDDDLRTLEQKIHPAWERLGPTEWVEPHYQTRVQAWFWHRPVAETSLEGCP